jgi:hypothetical protein
MTIFRRLVFLLCVTLFMLTPVSQTPRTYKIHDLENLQTVLNEVVKIENIDKLQSDIFPEDFEIEVRNISKKPIYFMHVVVIFSETSRLGLGSPPIGFTVSFGNNRKLISISNRPDPTDIPVKPGETFVLKPHPENVKSVRKYFEDRIGSDNVEDALSNIALSFQTINFGDGTGYLTGHAYPAKKVSQNVTNNKIRRQNL